jgi:hypothetical protein
MLENAVLKLEKRVPEQLSSGQGQHAAAARPVSPTRHTHVRISGERGKELEVMVMREVRWRVEWRGQWHLFK